MSGAHIILSTPYNTVSLCNIELGHTDTTAIFFLILLNRSRLRSTINFYSMSVGNHRIYTVHCSIGVVEPKKMKIRIQYELCGFGVTIRKHKGWKRFFVLFSSRSVRAEHKTVRMICEHYIFMYTPSEGRFKTRWTPRTRIIVVRVFRLSDFRSEWARVFQTLFQSRARVTELRRGTRTCRCSVSCCIYAYRCIIRLQPLVARVVVARARKVQTRHLAVRYDNEIVSYEKKKNVVRQKNSVKTLVHCGFFGSLSRAACWGQLIRFAALLFVIIVRGTERVRRKQGGGGRGRRGTGNRI
jgi:hypothetical protein